jgi:hypothetical protein
MKSVCDQVCMKKISTVSGESPSASAPVIADLQYIADSPAPEHGGFHPNAVQTAKAAIDEIHRLRIALLFYHEAWNGCERDWHTAMREASKNADKALWNE